MCVCVFRGLYSRSVVCDVGGEEVLRADELVLSNWWEGMW